MDPFETDEEHKDRKRWVVIVAFIIIVVLGLIIAGTVYWEAHKPLPQIKECKMIGFSAGTKMNGVIICYKDCTNNQLSSCRTRRLVQ